ncbi:MAG: agarase [Planctomycetota bacterium]
MKLSRRQWGLATAALTGAAAATSVGAQPAAAEAGFFRLEQTKEGWTLKTPDGNPFFSIGLNHIDPATLRYAENIDIWRKKYGGSIERWLKEAVRPDLEAWGFNTAGWVQEVVTRTPTNHRHSRSFTFDEYQWLGMPYCHLLPFADFHQWEAETRHPNLMSKDFEEWCDYVARADCAQFAGDRKLIGYFYIDCPTWVHTRPECRWKGPLFDPERLSSEAGRRELFNLATRYYQVTHDAIRRYDKHHLIFGDRYEGRASLPEEVVQAAAPYVDVLSFQHFSSTDEIVSDLVRWNKLTGKPVLLADAARHITLPDGSRWHDPTWYGETLASLRQMPACVGFHLCGAYLRNRCRQRGLRDEREQTHSASLDAIIAANRAAARTG